MIPTVPRTWHPYRVPPWDFQEALRGLSGDRLNTVLREAYDAGWSYETLGDVLGVSRQRVYKRVAVARYTPSASSVEVPSP